ncbi:hypothetical protein L1987_58079 [Smallanthus sonchifolius]|uniref:Uncharacterized protein n=1 Tax=Smallanthus sonchifolius TaxID=185202 RepID=A0ACB9DES1_9ASTR|nr:hypothetical protein L1987_58079 [Smallanthus sonchifolius]
MDEFIGNLKVHEIIMEKHDGISKVKKEKSKSFALKAKYFKSSSEEDNEQSNSDNDCPKPPSKDNKNNEFVGGAWSDSGDENDEAKEEKCLMAFGTNEVHFDSTYYSDKLTNNYDNSKMQCDGLCDLSSKVIDKNRSWKARIKELVKELLEIKNFNDVLIKDSNDLKKGNEILKNEMKIFQHHKQTLSTFNKSSEILDGILKAQKPSNEKSGLVFSNDTNVASTRKTKPTTFVKGRIVEVDRNILLKAKTKVVQTTKVSFEKPQVVKQLYKPKKGLGYVKNYYPRQVSRSYNSYPRRNNNQFYNYNKVFYT